MGLCFPSPSAGVGMAALLIVSSGVRPHSSLGPSAMLLPRNADLAAEGLWEPNQVMSRGPWSPQHCVLPMEGQAAPTPWSRRGGWPEPLSVEGWLSPCPFPIPHW